jgi:hypothetical protein
LKLTTKFELEKRDLLRKLKEADISYQTLNSQHIQALSDIQHLKEHSLQEKKKYEALEHKLQILTSHVKYFLHFDSDFSGERNRNRFNRKISKDRNAYHSK